MDEMMSVAHLSRNPGADIDAYAEYHRIVGDDDGGVTFTPEQYEAYKKRVIPWRINNRLYVSWTNPSGMDCKLIGPETPCFCTHRYKQHRTDIPEITDVRPIVVPCQAAACPCQTYRYVPKNGSQPLRCSGCKHFADKHHARWPNKCIQGACKCQKFTSSYSCGCEKTCDQHMTLVESKQERTARGHPIGQDVPYKAMGGITGFSSLAEGYQRLDPSGAGTPGKAFLNQPITSHDHPFLRRHVEGIAQYHEKKELTMPLAPPSERVVDQDKGERWSGKRIPGENDMDYYERRCQERIWAESRNQPKPLPYDETFDPRNFVTGERMEISKVSGSVVPHLRQIDMPGSSHRDTSPSADATGMSRFVAGPSTPGPYTPLRNNPGPQLPGAGMGAGKAIPGQLKENTEYMNTADPNIQWSIAAGPDTPAEKLTGPNAGKKTLRKDGWQY